MNFDGEDTTAPYQFPYVVRLPGCSGTLITANHVLTAAHCVDWRWDGRMTIRFVADDSTFSPDLEIAPIRCSILPEYNEHIDVQSSRPPDVFPGLPVGSAELDAAMGDRCGLGTRGNINASLSPYDFAILQLERPVPHAAVIIGSVAGSVRVNPLRVVTSFAGAKFPPAFAIVVGFGHMSVGGSGAGIRRYKALGNVSPIALIEVGGVTAGGDSEGPLLVDVGSGTEVLGVASSNDTWGTLGWSAGHGVWLDGQLDRNNDGRHDSYCPGGPARGVDPTLSAAADPDGDGYADSGDTCPGLYNPCQDPRDTDGDGTPDECDACIGDASISGYRGQVGPDADGDLLPDVCDCQPTIANTLDFDGDRVYDGCDNCFFLPNVDQANMDDDDFGDVCDPCPAAESPFTSIDSDGDGRPDECDNCALDFNPDQANCNLDAEIARFATEEGDVCDATPCAETSLIGAADPINYEYRVDRILLDALVPSGDENDYATGFRICPCELAAGDNMLSRDLCKVPETLSADGLRTGGCVIAEPSYYDLPQEDHPWRWAFVTDESDTAPQLPTTFGGPDELVLPYAPLPIAGSPRAFDLNTYWSLDDEVPRWQAHAAAQQAAGIPLASQDYPNENVKPPIRSGVFWSHGARDGGGGGLPTSTRELANHYWSGALPEPFDIALPPALSPCLVHVGPLVGFSCPACGGFPAAFVAMGGDFFDTCGGLNVPPRIAVPNLPMDLSAVIGLDPREAFLEPDLLWLAPSEPASDLPTGGARLVGLTRAGELAHVFDRSGTKLGERWARSTSPCADLSDCEGESLGRGPGRHGWTARPVLASTKDVVFRYAATHDGTVYEGSITVLSLDGRAIQTSSPGVLSLGVAVAMAYRMQDDALYFLLKDESAGVMHLARAPADLSQSGTLLHTYGLGGHDSFLLSVGAEGALWVASSVYDGDHQVCRFEQAASGDWVPQGRSIGAGALVASDMVASHAGLSLVTRAGGAGGNEAIVGHAVDVLAPLYEGDEADCF